MAIQGMVFGHGTRDNIQVAGLKTSDSKYIAAGGNSAFDANNQRIVEIHNLSASDCFFSIKITTANTATPSAANGSGFIAAKNSTRPFILPKNGVIKTTQNILVVSLDIETDA